MEEKIIRMGMVGCGTMSGAYLSQIESLSDCIKFTGLVDIDIERAKAAEASSPIANGAKLATDYREILDDVDALVLAIPHHLHRDIAIDCIKVGKHVLVEKPIANTEADSLDIINALEGTDVVGMHGYVMRHNPFVTKYGNMIQNGEYGDCFHLSLFVEQFTDCSRGDWVGKADQVGGGMPLC